MSLQRQVPAWDLLGPAIVNSAKLAAPGVRALHPALDPRRRDRRAPLRQGDRQVDHGRRDLARRDAGLRLRDRPHPHLRHLARLAAGHGAVARRRGPVDPDQVPAAACHDAQRRPLRVHRPHHAGRSDRRHRLRLHAHRVPQGAPVRSGHAQARAAERPSADDRRRRGPDRLPLRRARGGGVPLQLPGRRPPRPGCGEVQRSPAADRRDPPDRHHLPRRDVPRRPLVRDAQPPHPPRTPSSEHDRLRAVSDSREARSEQRAPSAYDCLPVRRSSSAARS